MAPDRPADPETGERIRAALDVYADPTGPADTRTAEMRRADALAEIADKAVADIDRPSGRGQIIIRMTADQLSTGLGVHWPSGALMTRADVDKLTCATTLTTVLGVDTPTGWHPVNVGYTHRYATRAQRAALEARDGPTCIADGCTSTCQPHHRPPPPLETRRPLRHQQLRPRLRLPPQRHPPRPPPPDHQPRR
ncbi:MAG: DUF222 domain-containing protein, partial [Microthrixaceae bacterium]